MRALSQFPQEHLMPLVNNLSEMRQAVFAADCWRSFWIITIGTAVLLAFLYRKVRVEIMAVLLMALCLFDLWQVDKRYLNDGMFVNADERELPQPMTETDKIILQDKSINYRVLNLASNTFNENETSYYHKSIGGYHAAKLRRYQELIEKYIHVEMQQVMSAIVDADGDMSAVSPEVSPVLNMLNAKYFILPMQGGSTAPLQNPHAMGNAWFVDKVTYSDNANEELDGMADIDLRHEAVADVKYKDILGTSNVQDSLAEIHITKYAPNHLEYTANSAEGGVVVFSEIYYPGWQVLIDGKPAELGRVNYVLRAVNVPAGKHDIVLDFHPQTLKITERMAYISYGVLLVALLLIILRSVYQRKQTGKK